MVAFRHLQGLAAEHVLDSAFIRLDQFPGDKLRVKLHPPEMQDGAAACQ